MSCDASEEDQTAQQCRGEQAEDDHYDEGRATPYSRPVAVVRRYPGADEQRAERAHGGTNPAGRTARRGVLTVTPGALTRKVKSVVAHLVTCRSGSGPYIPCRHSIRRCTRAEAVALDRLGHSRTAKSRSRRGVDADGRAVWSHRLADVAEGAGTTLGSDTHSPGCGASNAATDRPYPWTDPYRCRSCRGSSRSGRPSVVL